MRTIYRYQLNPIEEQTVELPQGAEILAVAFQGSDLQLWAQVETEAPDRPREFGVFATGSVIPQQSMRYIGTAFLNDVWPRLVFHVFEILA